MSKVLKKHPWLLMPLLILALALALGCSGGSDTSLSAAPADQPELGNQVGQRIHPFTMRLLDGTTVTPASLENQNKPTFLLYFKHP